MLPGIRGAFECHLPLVLICPMSTPKVAHPNDPLHGVTLERIVTELVAAHGWAGLAQQVPVRCFQFDPSIKSSLTFLRKTPWARTKVEALWCHLPPRNARQTALNK